MFNSFCIERLWFFPSGFSLKEKGELGQFELLSDIVHFCSQGQRSPPVPAGPFVLVLLLQGKSSAGSRAAAHPPGEGIKGSGQDHLRKRASPGCQGAGKAPGKGWNEESYMDVFQSLVWHGANIRERMSSKPAWCYCSELLGVIRKQG